MNFTDKLQTKRNKRINIFVILENPENVNIYIYICIYIYANYLAPTL